MESEKPFSVVWNELEEKIKKCDEELKIMRANQTPYTPLTWEELQIKADQAAAKVMKSKEQLEEEAKEIRAATAAQFAPTFALLAKIKKERKADIERMEEAMRGAK